MHPWNWCGVAGCSRRGFFGKGSPAASAAATISAHWRSCSACRSFCCCNKVCNTGNKKAAVLPLPVWLETIRSFWFWASGSCRVSGMACACTAVGAVKPRSATAFKSSGASPNNAKGWSAFMRICAPGNERRLCDRVVQHINLQTKFGMAGPIEPQRNAPWGRFKV